MTCEDYLEDPEANAAHAESCEVCRAITEDLDAEVDVARRPLRLEELPLAPWEGASHRTWPLVAAALAAMVTLAIVLIAAAGISPAAVAASSIPSIEALVKFLQLTGQALGAPVIALLFVAINTVLFLLLRRSPRGLDV